jgi:hypothetical protein
LFPHRRSCLIPPRHITIFHPYIWVPQRADLSRVVCIYWVDIYNYSWRNQCCRRNSGLRHIVMKCETYKWTKVWGG